MHAAILGWLFFDWACQPFFTLVTTLNYVNGSGAPQYQPKLGLNINLRPVTVTNGSLSRDLLIAAVGTGNGNGKLEMFFLDAGTGQVLDGLRSN